MSFDEEFELLTPPGLTGLPCDLHLTDRLLAAVRAYLQSKDLDRYQIYYGSISDFSDIDRLLGALNERSEWEPISPTGQSEALAYLKIDDGKSSIDLAGCLHLRKHQIVLARF